MIDLKIVNTLDGGDLELSGSDLATVTGVENTPFLAMFGGSDWVGNFLTDKPFNSRTEAVLNEVTLNTDGLMRITDAMNADLSYLSDIPGTAWTATAAIIAPNRVRLSVKINGEEFSYLWNPSETPQVATVPAICPVVTGLTCTDIGTSNLTFGWVDSGAVGYEYAYNITGDTPAAEDWIATSATEIALIDLTGGIEYFFFVRTKCATEFYSEPVSVSETTTPITCDMPTGLTVSPIGTNTATLNWVSPSTVGIKLKYVVNTTGIMPSLDFATGTAVDAELLSTNIIDLTPATHYYVWLRTRCDISNYSTWVSKEFDTI